MWWFYGLRMGNFRFVMPLLCFVFMIIEVERLKRLGGSHVSH